MLKVYVYDKCSTCRKALKFLDAHGIDYKTVPIRESPPSQAELRRMLEYYDGNLRRLFNTSSQDYRELGIKDELDAITPQQAFDMLRSNGNLVKRPFALGERTGAAGFKEDEWHEKFV